MEHISQEELEEQNIIDLPGRDALQVFAIGSPVTAVSIGVALNVFSPGSAALAGAFTIIG